MTGKKLVLVVNEINSILGENMAHIHTITKNNGVSYTGITIGETGLCPVFNTDSFDGRKSAKSIADEIIKTYETIPKEMLKMDTESMFNKEKVLEKVIPRLVNKTMNAEILSSVPHREVADDLCFIYVMYAVENGATKITNDFAERCGLTEEDLYNAAIKNAMKEKPVEKSLVQMMADLAGISMEEFPEEEFPEEENPCIVITNEQNYFGAHYIFIPEFLDYIHKKYGNFLMMPSSCHEVIIIPKAEITETEMKDNSDFIKETNEKAVLKQEVLANRAYFYDGEWH